MIAIIAVLAKAPVTYEAFNIQEYWIVDDLGLGGWRHIDSPKQPTFKLISTD